MRESDSTRTHYTCLSAVTSIRMPIRPILLQGHQRPLTHVQFNRDGDLLVTCAKDHKPNIWYTDNGERLGTYNGHVGTVWQCDISYDSTRLLTGSADRTCKLWELQTGREMYSWDHKAGVRSVAFATGEKMFLAAQDATFNSTPTIFIYKIAPNIEDQSSMPVSSMVSEEDPRKIGKYSTALWTSLNQTIVTCSDDGCLRMWDVERGKEIQTEQAHKKQINGMAFSSDRTMLITASSDQTAKLWDAKSLSLLRTFQSDRPINSASLSSLYPHAIIGGGQEAMDVTTTAAKAGHFETDFYNIIYSEYLCSVKGHFGPINSLSFSPNGKQFASGAEDGYIRLHHLPAEYFKNAH